MKKVAMATVGCRLNQYESDRIAERLTAYGMTRVDFGDTADLYILNSCTVTARADADCRKLLNRVGRVMGDAIIVVTGCYAVADEATVASLSGVDLVVGNDKKDQLPQIIAEKFPDLFDSSQPSGAVSSSANDSGLSMLGIAPATPVRARPMVKIGDGCDQSCSYCIVPSVRGRLTSRRPDDVILEVQKLIDGGVHEVVLSAVHIGGYLANGLNLAGLTEMILEKTKLSRLRLSSLEPNELDDHLLDLVAHHPRVCRHLHLPLQSGSEEILRAMRRTYSRQQYIEVIAKIKRACESITIGCDLIVGFPGETEADFDDSLDLLGCGHLDYGHVFSYSDRPGTVASNKDDKLPPQIIKERSKIARDRCRQIKSKNFAKNVGLVHEVISDRTPTKLGHYWAISDNFLKVKLPSGVGGKFDLLKFRATSASDDYLSGEIVA